jgi:CheY-like chemotaxis protein
MPRKLLIADDSVTVQRVVELTFANEGIDVVAVGDGAQAIAAIERERPDVVLADVSMPGRDGYEVAEFVKGAAHLSHTPVVLMTGAFEQVDESRARAVGCDGVLAKPFEPHMVVSLVARLLETAAPASPGTPASDAAPRAGFPFDPGAHVPATTTSLDDYFDRLDEALASAPAPVPRPAEPPPSAPATTAGAARGGANATGAGSLADVFSALLDDELGESRAPAAGPGLATGVPPASAEPGGIVSRTPAGPDEARRPVTGAEPALAAPLAISDELVDAVARRVIERLSDQAVRELVSATVLDVAERLVREEIEKIKSEA